jgi:spore coat polysaccharide biosynthesis predicted glycosyltransferase SpsG
LKISFITFGGREIGTGHLFRCLAIADWMRQLKLNAEISFHLYDSGFEEQNKALEILQSRSNYSCSIQNKNSINGMNFDIVVLDLLDVPIDLMELVKKKSNFLVSIADGKYSKSKFNFFLYSFLEIFESVVKASAHFSTLDSVLDAIELTVPECNFLT